VIRRSCPSLDAGFSTEPASRRAPIDHSGAQLARPCAPQLFDALVNRSIVRATGEHYGMIER